MFLKPFRIKSQSPCKSSDKKKLKLDINLAYPFLSPQQVEDLLPDKVLVNVVRIVTNGGVVVTTYNVNHDPLFFEHEKRIIPTVYAVERCPHMLRQIRLNWPSITTLKNGADLQLRWLNVDEKKGGLHLEGIRDQECCSILTSGKVEASGIAVSVMSSEAMLSAHKTDRGFKVLHIQGDFLWEMGSTKSPDPVDVGHSSHRDECTTDHLSPSACHTRPSKSNKDSEAVEADALTDAQAVRSDAIVAAILNSLKATPTDEGLEDASENDTESPSDGVLSTSQFYEEACRLLGIPDDRRDTVRLCDSEESEHVTGGNEKALKARKSSAGGMEEESESETKNSGRGLDPSSQKEMHLQKVKNPLQEMDAGLYEDLKDISKTSKFISLLTELKSRQHFQRMLEGKVCAAEDDVGISLPEKYKILNRIFGGGAQQVSGGETGEESTSGLKGKATRRSEEVEVGVAKSWYSILDHPVDAMPSIAGYESAEESCVQDMDDLMKECFLESLKMVKARATPLPLLTSTLYRSYMLEACPADMKLVVKKSSFKKLSRFLLTMQSRGLVNLKENEKGSEVITEIHYKHPEVKNYVPRLIPPSSSEVLPGDAKSIVINSLYMPTHRLLPLFSMFGYSKSSLLEFQQVREAVLKYIKDNQLADKDNPMYVVPDPVLSDALGEKGREGVKRILRQDIIKTVADEMKPAYSIMYGKGSPIIRRGKLEPIRLTLSQRMGNKKVTLVDNLEVYGIPASDVAHSLQRIAAASATVIDVPGRPSAHQVLVQGNAIKVVAKLLEDNYGLPIKFIEAINKIKPPKPTKKKKKRK